MKKILVSTTDSLIGWQIENYLEPVTATVLITGNWLAEWNVSVAGIFGDRAGNFERRIDNLNRQARRRLEMTAAELGANCILGFKIDVCQISGNEMHLFMVTATGTAVVVRSLNDPKAGGPVKAIGKDKLIISASLIRLAEQVKTPDYKVTMSDLQLITDNRASEFSEFVFTIFNQPDSSRFDTETYESFDHIFREYFSLIEPADAARVLCEGILKIKTKNVFQKVLGMIKDYALVDFEIVSRMLNGEVHEQKTALVLLQYDKPVYIYEDIALLQNIIGLINRAFPLRARIATKKGFLTSEDKEIWVCECRQSNDVDVTYCANCGNDKYGFRNTEIGPERTIALLQHKVAALGNLW